MKNINKAILCSFTMLTLAFGSVVPAAAADHGNQKRAMEIVATAYAPGPHDNGKWGNLTHIGTTVRPGIIAVDPKVIPLGSRVQIEFPDGRRVYATAEDTGGAIKGNRIDIAMATVAEAYDFGIQKVKVTVLK
jgi:3D (Asp-Asp-Asp) domain-containing protein